jgi:hypothetical protein
VAALALRRAYAQRYQPTRRWQHAGWVGFINPAMPMKKNLEPFFQTLELVIFQMAIVGQHG